MFLDQQIDVPDYTLLVQLAIASEPGTSPQLFFYVRGSADTIGYIFTLIHQETNGAFLASVGVEEHTSPPHEQIFAQSPERFNVLPYGNYSYTTVTVTVKGAHLTMRVGDTTMIDTQEGSILQGGQVGFGDIGMVISITNVTIDTA